MSVFFIDCEDGQAEKLKLDELQTALGKFVQSDTPLAVELLFVDGEEIRKLNAETRQTDKVTDVLSFPTLDGIKGKKIKGKQYKFDMDEEGRLMLGSIVICQDRAKEQAEEYGHSYERELHYLLVHGVMHCLGYDHMTDEEKAELREKEEQILEAIAVTRV